MSATSRHPTARLAAAGMVLVSACAVFVLSWPVSASADVFGPISLVSAGSVTGGAPQQAEYAHDPAISGNGRYVAFDGSVGGVTGVWRKDLQTGAIQQVAGGDAELPSISESGRYISFTTTEAPVAGYEAKGPNVWVRDMQPSGEQPQYILVSAKNGSSQGLAYEYGSDPSREEGEFGAVAAGRSAISADGQEVAFVTTTTSDLAGPHSAPLQVAVRYLASDETKLVSGEYDAATGQTTETPVSVTTNEGREKFGAVFPGQSRAFRAPPPYEEWKAAPPPGASISADGSTVAWMGEDIGKQARMLAAESPEPLYTEPLWRRIAPGSQTPTARVTGGSDPANPGCAASGELALTNEPSPTDPCEGPFLAANLSDALGSSGIWPGVRGTSAGIGDFVPRLSADGYTVAFISGALPIALGENFNASRREGEQADLYVANMHAGLTRDQALTPLTELAGNEALADNEQIEEFDISPDGGQVAFTTRRTQFPLGFPAYISAPSAEPGLSELFDADVADGTLTRVTHGYAGGPSEQPHGPKEAGEEDLYSKLNTYQGAQSPSFSTDGTLLSFSSTASNLVFGDGNTPPAGVLDGSDAFVVPRIVLGTLPTPQYVSPAPETSTVPAWVIGATDLARSDGSVVLYVQTPGAGILRAAARSTVLVSVEGARRSRSRHRVKSRLTLAKRDVAGAGRTARAVGGELVMLVLRLGNAYASLASRHGGLSATVTLSFSANGHSTLHGSMTVTFLHRKQVASHARKGSAVLRSGGRR